MERRIRAGLCCALLLVLVAALPACDDDDDGVRPGDVTGERLELVPAAIELGAGASQDFDVVGQEDDAIVWDVIGASPSGSIDQDGVYTAPSSVDRRRTVLVEATLLGPPRSEGIAEVTLAP